MFKFSLLSLSCFINFFNFFIFILPFCFGNQPANLSKWLLLGKVSKIMDDKVNKSAIVCWPTMQDEPMNAITKEYNDT